jgi:hypothetical protein
MLLATVLDDLRLRHRGAHAGLPGAFIEGDHVGTAEIAAALMQRRPKTANPPRKHDFHCGLQTQRSRREPGQLPFSPDSERADR